MRSFKSLYKGLILGLSLSILGLGSVYCGGSPGGSSGGNGTKNHAPTVSITSPANGSSYFRSSSPSFPVEIKNYLELKGSYTDEDNDKVTCSWNTGGLTSNPSGLEAEVLVPYNAIPGTFVIGLDCIDEHGLPGSAERKINVQNNRPIADIVGHGTTPSIPCGSTVPFDFRSSYDIDGTITNYHTIWGDGEEWDDPDEDGIDFHSYNCELDRPTTVPVELKVTDNNDSTSTNTDTNVLFVYIP